MCIFHVIYKIGENVLKVHTTSIKAIVFKKPFCRENKQTINENIIK